MPKKRVRKPATFALTSGIGRSELRNVRLSSSDTSPSFTQASKITVEAGTSVPSRIIVTATSRSLKIISAERKCGPGDRQSRFQNSGKIGQGRLKPAIRSSPMNSTPASRRDGSKHFANRLFFQSRAYGLQRQSAINSLPVFRANSHAAPRQMIRSPRPALRLDTTYRIPGCAARSTRPKTLFHFTGSRYHDEKVLPGRAYPPTITALRIWCVNLSLALLLSADVNYKLLSRLQTLGDSFGLTIRRIVNAVLLVGLVLVQLGGFAVLYFLFVQNGRILLRVEAIESSLRNQGLLASGPSPDLAGLPRGSVLTDFSLPTLNSGTVSLYDFRGRRVLLIFFNPGCAFCLDFLEELARAGFARADDDPAIVIISQDDAAETRQLFDRFPVPYPVLIETGAELSSLYQIHGTPTGYLVDETGKTASGLLFGGPSLLAAMKLSAQPARARGRSGVTKSLPQSRLVRDGLKKGATAPSFTLPALDGTEISLSDFQGKRILLVFSDPQCQPCQDLVPKLERIHRAGKGITVLMISRGDVELNKEKAAEHWSTFPIALQRHWEISRAYGIFATPVGYVIDDRGVLASDAAVGGDAILQLAAQRAVPVEEHSSLLEVKS